MELLEDRRLLSTITVNTTSDDDALVPSSTTLSLRQAIELVNGTLNFSSLSEAQQSLISPAGQPPAGGPNTVDFHIPGTGSQTILVGSTPYPSPNNGLALPAIHGQLTIDGYSQPGASPNTLQVGDNASMQIVLDGSQVRYPGPGGNGADGLTLTGNGSVIQGMSITNFPHDGIVVGGASATSNLIQGNFLGISPVGSAQPNANSGVDVIASGNTIGGTSPAARNVISGNHNLDGVSDGVLIQSAFFDSVSAVASSNQVLGNYIGTDLTGNGPNPVANDLGVSIAQSDGNTISGNVISGNSSEGILLSSSSSNLITGNIIGSRATTTSGTLPNGIGIWITALASNSTGNTIGGSVSGTANVISGNAADGIDLIPGSQGGTISGTVIEGNFIGTDASGTALPNNEGGINIADSPSNTIGGLTTAQGNTIGANGASGVFLSGPAAEFDSILSNTFLAGQALQGAIVLTSGANNNQAAPVITSVNYSGGNLIVNGTFTSQTSYTGSVNTIQIFGTDFGNESAYSLLATVTVPITYPATGGTFQATIPVRAANFQFLTATATDQLGNSSQLSQAFTLPGEFDFGAPTYTVEQTGGSVAVTVNRNGGTGGTTTVTYATGGGTAVPGVDYTPASGVLTFAAGQSSQSFTITILNNLLLGSARTIDLTLSSPTGGAQLGTQPTATVIITNTNTLVVTNTNDSGRGSLRQAILVANTNPGLNTITFAIPGTGLQTISPLSTLPALRDPVVIDATTQPGFDPQNPRPVVELDGASAGNSDGLTLNAGGSTIKGLDIARFSQHGIFIASNNNLITADSIGTDPTGTKNLGNGSAGIGVMGTGNTIGGTANGAGNVISGNVAEGVFIRGGGNLILGNLIGLNASGTAALGNGLSGVTIQDASGNTIQGNVLSGNGVGPNGGAGVVLNGTNAVASSNIVAGNFIGTDISGTVAIPNVSAGLGIVFATNNTIGGPTSTQRNVISGNGGPGLLLQGATTTGNLVENNFIGTDKTGTAALANQLDGVSISNAPDNMVGPGNVISGNGQAGLEAAGVLISGAQAVGNQISNNRIGTDVSGTKMLGNSLHGVFLGSGAQNNMVGPGNLISGNGTTANQGVGVYIFGSSTTGNQVLSNRIGTNAAGNASLTNAVIGVLINQSPSNLVQGNVLSGNRFIGLEIAGATATGNQVLGNRIGTDATGTAAVPNGFDGVFLNNAPNNSIGGTTAGAGNLISGNRSVGIQLFGPQSTGNVIQGNALGLNVNGQPTLPNRAGGIFVNTGPQSNTVGGTAPGQTNRGQSRPHYSLSGFHQSRAASHTKPARHAVRRPSTQTVRPRLLARHHWPMTGGGVSGKPRRLLP